MRRVSLCYRPVFSVRRSRSAGGRHELGEQRRHCAWPGDVESGAQLGTEGAQFGEEWRGRLQRDHVLWRHAWFGGGLLARLASVTITSTSDWH